GGEGRRLPAKASDRLEHLQERLRRQVLGVVAVADAHVQVAVDAVEVQEIELLERFAVSLLRLRDELTDVPGRLARSARDRLLAGPHPALDARRPRPANAPRLLAAEADAALAGEALDVDHAPKRDRVPPVGGLERQGAVLPRLE